ncbi:hypothetical protein MC885_014637, partial [Smutsia gigantea]
GWRKRRTPPQLGRGTFHLRGVDAREPARAGGPGVSARRAARGRRRPGCAPSRDCCVPPVPASKDSQRRISTSSSDTATPTPSSSSQPIRHPALGLDLGLSPSHSLGDLY